MILSNLQYKLDDSPTPSDEEAESSDDEDDAFGPKKEKVEEDPVKSTFTERGTGFQEFCETSTDTDKTKLLFLIHLS